jgi:hypothetical protein
VREAYIVAAGRIVDGAGRLDAVEEVERGLAARGVTAEQLVIDPLEAGWDTPVAAGHFRSGCAPIEALAVARRAILAGEARAFVIRGEDLLRTRYRQDKALRSRLMTIYGDACPIPLAYTNLARAFMRRRAMTQDVFLRLAAALYQNYVRTAEAHGWWISPDGSSC